MSGRRGKVLVVVVVVFVGGRERMMDVTEGKEDEEEEDEEEEEEEEEEGPSLALYVVCVTVLSKESWCVKGLDVPSIKCTTPLMGGVSLVSLVT